MIIHFRLVNSVAGNKMKSDYICIQYLFIVSHHLCIIKRTDFIELDIVLRFSFPYSIVI